MADHATRQAQRSGDLAAQLAAEVRAGRPERARLRAYCGCEAARFVLGRAAPVRYVDEADPEHQLRVWLAGLQRLAWAPPRLNVDPEHWVLTVAACGAIEAAEQWARCPCNSCREAWFSNQVSSLPDWVAASLRDVPSLRGAIQAASQIIGPDAAREAAARAVLEVTA